MCGRRSYCSTWRRNSRRQRRRRRQPRRPLPPQPQIAPDLPSRQNFSYAPHLVGLGQCWVQDSCRNFHKIGGTFREQARQGAWRAELFIVSLYTRACACSAWDSFDRKTRPAAGYTWPSFALMHRTARALETGSATPCIVTLHIVMGSPLLEGSSTYALRFV